MVICQCYDKALSCGKKEAAVEFTVKFFVTLVASCKDDVFLSFVNYLLERSHSLDKIVRFRSCQTISGIFKEFPEDAEIDNVLWDTLTETLLPRLRDKCPNVRMWSVKALKDLHDPADAEDPILKEFLRLVHSDASKDVRIAVIDAIIPSKFSLGPIIERLRDVKTEVRVAATQNLLDKVEINHLTQKQRGIVIKYSLNDREEAVREKALDLIVKWLHSPAVDNSVPKLLYMIGLVGNSAESELTAWSLIEAGAIDKQFIVTISGEKKNVSLKSFVENDVMNWQRSFTGIPPAELLWTLLRCDFYNKSLSNDRYLEKVESFLPDTVVLCELLKEGHGYLTEDECPQLYEISMEFLLRITAFIDTSDIAGSNELINTCKAMVKDLKFLETLIEPVLSACCQAMTSAGQNIGEEMAELSQELWPSVFEGESSDENPFQPKNPDIDLAQLRSLQVAAWTIQNQTARSCVATPSKNYATETAQLDSFIPMILQSLQQPIKELRSAALRCLGLLGISSEKHCESFAGIVLQVASANQEDSFIRCQAIESLTDMALVHSDALISQESLATLLIRMIDCDMPLIQRIAGESSAKLLFSGRILKSPSLFARLIRLFFSPIESDDDSEIETYASFSNPQAKKSDASKGSEAYLDQMLSVFFPAFFGAGGDRVNIILDSVVPLISFCAMCVRDGISTSIPLQKIIEHLLSWCDFIPQPTEGETNESIADITRQQLKERLCSVCFKEILSLDSASPSSKILLKEICKLFGLLIPCDWIKVIHMGNTVLKVCRFVKSQCALDKVSSKHLSTFYSACQEHVQKMQATESLEDTNDTTDILSFCPGLTDMLSGWCDDNEAFDDKSEDTDDYNATANEDVSGDIDVPVRSRIARASKNSAKSRISKQLSNENIKNSNSKMVSETEDLLEEVTDSL